MYGSVNLTRLTRLLPLLVLLTNLMPLPHGCLAGEKQRPEIPLANIYHEGVDLDGYWVSEKLDGVRAYWDGQNFLSRSGNPYAAPAWFTDGFPKLPLDGELWMGRNSFQQLVSVVRRNRPDDEDWRAVRYMVFDLPHAEGGFTERLESLERLLGRIDSPFIRLLPQYRLPDHRSLMENLTQLVEAGGEGLMLHRGSSIYRAGRSNDLLKVKPYLDAEAKVIAHLPGQGKFTGMLGSLLVESAAGRRFRIGTGFSDADRIKPPPIGSLITYKYHGFTDAGLPRFASYLRVREQ